MPPISPVCRAKPSETDTGMKRWVVVGGGSAGCVVASRLSEDPANDVTLVEAGPDHGSMPAAYDVGPLHDRGERTHYDSPVPRGFGLGGTSLINGTLAYPDPDHPDVVHRIPITSADPDKLGAVGGALMASAADARLLHLTRRRNRRVTAADAYIRKLKNRTNLRVLTRTSVIEVVIEGRRAVGVITDSGEHLVADRVVVCAGAIGSPELLLRSRIDTPGIGEGLQNHAAVMIMLELAEPVDSRKTPMFSTVLDRPGRQVLPMNFLSGTGELGAVLTALMQVDSVGNVTLPDLGGRVELTLDPVGAQADVDGMAAAMAETIQLLDHPAFKEVAVDVFLDDWGTPLSALTDAEGIRKWFKYSYGSYHHYSSTCRIGVVTDDRGAVHGYNNLFVCDASLFPRVPPVNPYISVITLAERLTASWRAADDEFGSIV